MRKFIAVALVALLSNNIFAQTLQDAQKEIDRENFFKAKQILNGLLKSETVNKADVYYYLGNAYLNSEDLDSAKVYYKLVWNPDNRTALGYLANGRLALLNKNAAETKLNYDRALQITKMKNANIYYEIGDSYIHPELKDVNAAITNLEAAFNLDNKNPAISIALADAYNANSANDNSMGGKAMNKYEYAVELDKKAVLAYIKMGRIWVNGKVYPSAIENYNKALAIDPSYAIVYKELGEAYYYSKQYDKMKENFEKYVSLSPGDLKARTNLAVLYFQGKEYDKAIEESTKGLVNDPNNFVYDRILAFANFELKRYKDAAEASKKFWANPTKKVKDIDYIYSARIASEAGDGEGAMKYFDQALVNDSANCDLLGEYGKVLFKAKKYAAAASKYNTKKDACGSLTSLDVFYLGRSYMLAGDSLKADSAFAEFSQRNPTSPDGYWWRARVNLTLGKTEDYLAMPYYLKYTEIAGTEPAKYKKNLTEAFVYLGIYNFEKAKNKEEAKAYFTKALELDPADELATLYMKQF